jgi:hypothetical protein
MLLRRMITVYCENDNKALNKLCMQNAEILVLKQV